MNTLLDINQTLLELLILNDNIVELMLKSKNDEETKKINSNQRKNE